MKVLLGTKSDRREHRVYPDVTASCDEIYRKIDFTAIVEEEE
jgi:hypothetical protein